MYCPSQCHTAFEALLKNNGEQTKNSVWFFMSCHPRNLRQIGAGWLWGLFSSSILLHVKHHVVILADWMTSSATGASPEPWVFAFYSCDILYFFSWMWKELENENQKENIWVAGEAKIVTQWHKWRIKTLFWENSAHNLSVLFLLQACCSADWVFWLPGLGIQIFFSDIGRKNSLQRRLLQSVSGMWVYFSEKALISSVFLSA